MAQDPFARYTVGGSNDPFARYAVKPAEKPKPTQEQPKGSDKHPYAQLTQNLGDVLIGALRGAGERAINLGEFAHRMPGVSRVVDATLDTVLGEGDYRNPQHFASARQEYTQAANPAQEVGKGLEQLAEIVGTGGAVRSLAQRVPALASLPGRVATEAVAGGMLGAAQTGDPTSAGVSAGISAAVPVVGRMAGSAVNRLRGSAQGSVQQALGATKERYKAMAEKIGPEVLKRQLSGSRESLKAQAESMLQQVGQQIDDALAQYGQRSMSTAPIVDALEQSKNAFRVPVATAEGGTRMVATDPRAVRQLEGLQKLVSDVGETATADQLVAIRRAWDRVVSQAGGYQQRATGAIGVPLRDQSEAFAKREGATAIRKLLNAEMPELSAINKEFAFWKNLDEVLGQTLKRTAPQSGGLRDQIAKGTGAMVGGTAGATTGPLSAIGGAALGAGVTKMLNNVLTSPRWHLVSAQLKDKLANALMSGQQSQVLDALGRITAVEFAKVGR